MKKIKNKTKLISGILSLIILISTFSLFSTIVLASDTEVSDWINPTDKYITIYDNHSGYPDYIVEPYIERDDFNAKFNIYESNGHFASAYPDSLPLPSYGSIRVSSARLINGRPVVTYNYTPTILNAVHNFKATVVVTY